MKKISIIIAVLAVLLVVINVSNKKNERSFKKYAVQVDTSLVTQVIIKPKGKIDDDIIIKKDDDKWYISLKTKEVQMSEIALLDILSQIKKLKVNSVVSTAKNNWNKYEVTDSAGINVIVKNNNKELADFIIGKFSYKQSQYGNPYQQPNMLTYVRVKNDDNVYSVNGYLNITFNKNINSFRENKIIKGEYNNWVKMHFNYGTDNAFIINKKDGKWNINGVEADSTTITNYLSDIEMLTSNKFADSINIQQNTTPIATVQIEQENKKNNRG